MSNNDKDDLIGFRDFIDNDQGKSDKRSAGTRSKNDFELITFLEQDSQRLSNHIETFEEKAYVIKNYSQDPSLNIEAEHLPLAHQHLPFGPLSCQRERQEQKSQ